MIKAIALPRKAYPVVLIASALVSTFSYGGQNPADQIISALDTPVGWRALGTVAPGYSDGVKHDLYTNSAVIAAAMQASGTKVPFVKLTDDPAMGLQALSDYLGRIKGDKVEVTEETCGVAVSHLYSASLASLLNVYGPQVVNYNLSDSEAKAKSESARQNLKTTRELAYDLCDSWKYRNVRDGFEQLLKSVESSLPYLLPRASQLAMRDKWHHEEEQKKAQAMETVRAEKAASARKGEQMIATLQKSGIQISEDPYAQCLEIDTQSTYQVKNSCLSRIQDKEWESYIEQLKSAISIGFSQERTKALILEVRTDDSRIFSECQTNQEDFEDLYRCVYVKTKLKQLALKESPPKTDVQLGQEALARAVIIAPNGKSDITNGNQSEYQAELESAIRYGNTEAMMLLAQVLAENKSDVKSLARAESLLDEYESVSGGTAQTQVLRSEISPILQEVRFQNSPQQQRKSLRASSQNPSDLAIRAAVALDDMTLSGGSCDSIVVSAYNMAYSNSLPVNSKLLAIERYTDTLVNIRCIN